MSNRLAHTHAETFGTWLKALAGNDRARAVAAAKGLELKASGELVGSSGGFLVPDTAATAILSAVDDHSAFMSNADVINTTSMTVNRPRRTGGLSANWVQENATIPSSDPVLDNVSLSLRKLAILVKSSAELYDDSASNLGAWLADEIALAFASTIDDCGFNGDGTDDFAGMRGLSTMLTGTDAASGHDAFGDVDISDVANLVAAVQGNAIRSARWFCSPQFVGQLARLSASTGGFSNSGGLNYLGWPVSTSPSIATTGSAGVPFIYFGDLKRTAILAQRSDMTIAVSRQHAAEADQVWLRAVWRVAIAVHESSGTMGMLLGKS